MTKYPIPMIMGWTEPADCNRVAHSPTVDSISSISAVRIISIASIAEEADLNIVKKTSSVTSRANLAKIRKWTQSSVEQIKKKTSVMCPDTLPNGIGCVEIPNATNGSASIDD